MDGVRRPQRFQLPGTVSRLAVQFRHVGILDMATRLAAQAFLTALPVLFVVAALAPDAWREQMVSSVRDLFGLRGASLEQVRSIYAGGDQFHETWGVIGVLVTLLSATACSRALQRLCERSWHLRRAGARVAAWRWVLWLLVWLAALLLQGALRDGFGVGTALGVPLSLCAAVLLWWWTQHLLLGSRVAWLRLLPGAVLAGGGSVAVVAASRLFLPRALNHSIEQFGALGSVFTMLSWLIAFFAVITAGVAAGYVLADEPRLAPLLTREGKATPAGAHPTTGSKQPAGTDGAWGEARLSRMRYGAGDVSPGSAGAGRGHRVGVWLPSLMPRPSACHSSARRPARSTRPTGRDVERRRRGPGRPG
jgi:membrane protein